MSGIEDLIARDKDIVCREIKDTEFENIATVEGTAIPGASELLTMKVLMATEHVIVLRAERKKGLKDPKHKHDHHDTVSTLISGKLEVHVGDESFMCEPGAVWRHRPGVPHWSDTLEDSVVIEIKTPPEKTW